MSIPSAPLGNSASVEDRLTMDPVTGLRNEYLFRLRLQDEFFRARECETNAALLAVKLDKIVDINARHGRNGGDDALRALGNLLRTFQSGPENASHLLFKLAGPVFGYFMPACDTGRALTVAGEMVKETFLSDLFIERMTVSIGLVDLYEFFLRDEDPVKIAGLIERTALQRVAIAEKNGGNTVCHVSGVPDSSSGAVPRVLIVDPDEAAMELLVRALKTAGFVVETCRNGETAHTLVQANPPSAIVCEAMIPRMNGFMLRDRLRANALLAAVPFILVSHKKTEEFIRQAADLDIRYYFRKPFSITEIAGLISNLARSDAA